MRTSRVSKDTARLFDRTSAITTSRRVTRSSLGRFSYATTTSNDAPSKLKNEEEEGEEQKEESQDEYSLPSRKRRRLTASSPVRIKSELVDATSSTILSTAAVAPETEPASGLPARRERKPARRVKTETGDSKVLAPSNWEEIYEVVREMRSPGGAAYGAAVDTMGCERLADPDASPKDQRFHTLVALMLSSQTKDTVNAEAMRRLKTEMPPFKKGASLGLNLDNMLAVDPEALNKMIWAVGFHNNKTKYLKQAALILRDEWDGDIPSTITGLTSLPGVGPKMAHLCLSAAWGRTEGIGVDVHVHRITNLWGWHRTTKPEDTRMALESWLPRDRWREINGLLVGLGQAVCLPVGRRCGDCEVGMRGLCRAADRAKVSEGRRRREQQQAQGEGGSRLLQPKKVLNGRAPAGRATTIKTEVKTEVKTEPVGSLQKDTLVS